MRWEREDAISPDCAKLRESASHFTACFSSTDQKHGAQERPVAMIGAPAWSPGRLREKWGKPLIFLKSAFSCAPWVWEYMVCS